MVIVIGEGVAIVMMVVVGDDKGVVVMMIFVDMQYYNLLHYSRLNDRAFGSIGNMESSIKANTWHHIAVTYDYENGKQAIYRDGIVRHYFFDLLC